MSSLYQENHPIHFLTATIRSRRSVESQVFLLISSWPLCDLAVISTDKNGKVSIPPRERKSFTIKVTILLFQGQELDVS